MSGEGHSFPPAIPTLHQACFPNPQRNGPVITRRHKVLEDLRSHRRTQTVCIEEIFNAYWNAVKGTAEPFAPRLGLTFTSFLQDGFSIDSHPCPNLLFEFIYSREESLH